MNSKAYRVTGGSSGPCTVSHSQNSILAEHYNGMRFITAEFNNTAEGGGQRIHYKSDRYYLLDSGFSIHVFRAQMNIHSLQEAVQPEGPFIWFDNLLICSILI
jgi:hypothetical protein